MLPLLVTGNGREAWAAACSSHPKARSSFLSILPWQWRATWGCKQHSCTQFLEDSSLPKHPACKISCLLKQSVQSLEEQWWVARVWHLHRKVKKCVLSSLNIVGEYKAFSSNKDYLWQRSAVWKGVQSGSRDINRQEYDQFLLRAIGNLMQSKISETFSSFHEVDFAYNLHIKNRD